MLDGAALATLIIGLESARMTSESPQTAVRSPAARHPLAGIRIRLAVALRLAADRLDRRSAVA
jgi:hypothetical protein